LNLIQRLKTATYITLAVGALALATSAAARGLEGRIAYSRSENGNDEIFTMNADGTKETNVSNHPANDWHPSFSPDGQQIVFASNRSGNHLDRDIYVMDSDGSSQVNLTNNQSSNYSPDWSPDGTRIAYESSEGGNVDVWVMGADGSNRRNLTNFQSGLDYYPTWPPDSQRIAFTSIGRDWSTLPAIYVMDSNGSNVELISERLTDADRFPAWSPTGDLIAYQSIILLGEDIVTMTPRGTKLDILTVSNIKQYQPFWSPDGEYIAFTSNMDGIGGNDIYVMDRSGDIVARLTQGTKIHHAGSWTPHPLEVNPQGRMPTQWNYLKAPR
jgi:TolB protein